MELQLLIVHKFNWLSIVLLPAYIFRSAGVWQHENSGNPARHRLHWFKRMLAQTFWTSCLYYFLGFRCVDGMFTEVIVVFRNHSCHIGTDKWLGRGLAYVNLAIDTEDARSSTKEWMYKEITVNACLVCTAYSGLWYQNFARL